MALSILHTYSILYICSILLVYYVASVYSSMDSKRGWFTVSRWNASSERNETAPAKCPTRARELVACEGRLSQTYPCRSHTRLAPENRRAPVRQTDPWPLLARQVVSWRPSHYRRVLDFVWFKQYLIQKYIKNTKNVAQKYKKSKHTRAHPDQPAHPG